MLYSIPLSMMSALQACNIGLIVGPGTKLPALLAHSELQNLMRKHAYSSPCVKSCAGQQARLMAKQTDVSVKLDKALEHLDSIERSMMHAQHNRQNYHHRHPILVHANIFHTQRVSQFMQRCTVSTVPSRQKWVYVDFVYKCKNRLTLLGHTDCFAPSSSGLCMLTLDTQTPVVPQTSVIPADKVHHVSAA